MAQCLSCGAQIEWALSETGARMPLDVEPTEDGNIVLSHRQVGQPPVALVQGPLGIEMLRIQHERSPDDRPFRLFRSHHFSCPHGKEWRNRPRQEVTQ